MIIILNDDPVYVSWLRRHRGGFVLETRRKASRRNTMLHRASCAQIRKSKTKHTRWTTGGRAKACSEDRDELMQWARDQFGRDPRLCASCDPADDDSLAAKTIGHRATNHRLTKLESDIVSAVVESAVIHLDNNLEYSTTIGDVAKYLSKTPAQISAALLRLVAAHMLEIESGSASGDLLSTARRVLPTASSLGAVPAFADMSGDQLQRELATLRDRTS